MRFVKKLEVLQPHKNTNPPKTLC